MSAAFLLVLLAPLSAVSQSTEPISETIKIDEEQLKKAHEALAAEDTLSSSKPVVEEKFRTHGAVSTNLVEWVNFATLNIAGSIGVARHWTIHLEAKFNPWQFGGDGRYDPWDFDPEHPCTITQNKVRTFNVGARWWPWFVYSGWWIGAKLQYQEYNRANELNHFFGIPGDVKTARGYRTEEGDAYGVGLSAGYTFMLHKNLNMEVGIGGWGGYKKYTTYACPQCGRIIDQGEKGFFLPSDLLVSFVYVF